MPKEIYVAALVALQNTIDENSKMYPELARTLKAIQDAPGDAMQFVKLTDPNIYEVMARGKASKVGVAEQDLAYCDARLQRADLGEEERKILTKSEEYLTKSQA